MKGNPNPDVTATEHIRMAIADLVLDEFDHGGDLVSTARPSSRIYDVLYRLAWAVRAIESAERGERGERALRSA